MINDEAKTALGVALPQSFVLPSLSLISQRIFGVNEFSARLPFALLGALGILLYYFLGKEIKDEKAGIFFAFVGAILPGNIILSRSSLLDVSLVTSWILLLIFWLRHEKKPTQLNSFLLFLALFLPMWLKIQAIYLLFTLVVYLIWINRGHFWSDIRFWLILFALVPFFSYYVTQFQQLWDLKHYVTLEFGRSVTDLRQFLVFYIEAHTSWLLLGFIGVIIFIKSKWKNFRQNPFGALIVIFFIVVLLALILIPKRFYYSVMFDIPIIYFSWFLASGIQKGKYNFVYFSAGTVGCVLILIYLGNFGDYYCQLNILNCHWQKNVQQINYDIKNAPGTKYLFLDPLIGYEGKWYVHAEILKYDYLPNFINNFGKNDSVIIIVDKSRARELLIMGEWKKINDYGVLESYIRPPQ